MKKKGIILNILRKINFKKRNYQYQYIPKDSTFSCIWIFLSLFFINFFRVINVINEIYNDILDAPLITYEKSIIYTQKQKSLDRDEKIKLQKYYMCNKLGLDVLT